MQLVNDSWSIIRCCHGIRMYGFFFTLILCEQVLGKCLESSNIQPFASNPLTVHTIIIDKNCLK